MILIATLGILFDLGWAAPPMEEDEVTIEAPELLCKVDQFSLRAKKAPFKGCDGLLDARELKVATARECKDRALAKAKTCLSANAGVEQLSVRAKFTEKFSIRSVTNSFTCEMDRKGESACP